MVEHLLDTGAGMQVNERAYAAFHQLDEELRERALLRRPCDVVPARVWVHPSACYPAQELHEDEDQGE